MESNYSNNQQGNSQMQPPPYGQQTQSNNTQKSNGLGIASFVLGVIGFLTGIFIIGIFFDVIAIVLGIAAIISKKNKNGFAIAGSVLSIVSIILVVFVLNVFDTSDKKESSKKNETTITSEDNTENKEVENNVEQIEEIASYDVGDVVEGKYLKITYLSCEDYNSDNQFIQPKDGNKFIQLEFEFENIGDSDKHVSTFAFNGYADGYNVEKSYTDTDLSASLSTGKKAKGTVTFEVPADATEISVEYEENSFIGDKIIFTVN